MYKPELLTATQWASSVSAKILPESQGFARGVGDCIRRWFFWGMSIEIPALRLTLEST